MNEQPSELQLIRRALLQAAEEEYKEALAAVPDAPPFSAKYRRWEKSFLRNPHRAYKTATLPKGKRLLRKVACFLVALSVVFSTIMVGSPTARAAVIRWFIEKFDTHISYNYKGTVPNESLGDWAPSYLPSGYYRDKVVDLELVTLVYYRTDDPEMEIEFSYRWIANGTGENLDTEHHTITNVSINGMLGQLFTADPDTNGENMLLWFDEDSNRSFLLMSPLPCDTLLDIAESVRQIE